MKLLENLIKLFEKFGWEFWNWLAQLGFTLIGSVFFTRAMKAGLGDASKWYYFVLAIVFIATATVNCLLLKGRTRSFISVVHVVLNAYVIPFSYYSYGLSIRDSALASVVYVLVTVALSPRLVGFFAMCGGICFALFQKSYYQGLGSNPYGDISKIAAAYVALALLGYCWRLVAQKMYEIFSRAYMVGPGSVAMDEETLERLDNLERSNRMLKEEIAMHIIEIDKIVNSPKKELPRGNG